MNGSGIILGDLKPLTLRGVKLSKSDVFTQI